MNKIKTHLIPIHGSVVAVRVSPATALVNVGDPTDAEIAEAVEQHPDAMRKISKYLKEHNNTAYRRNRCGFGAGK